MAIAFSQPRLRITDGNGAPAPGARLYFFTPGSVNVKQVFQDTGLVVPHTQPVVADSTGLMPVIFGATGLYDVVCVDANEAHIWDVQNYDFGISTGAGALPVSAGGTGAASAAAARANLGAASAADVSGLSTDVSGIESQIAASLVGGTRLGLLAGKDSIKAENLDDADFGVLLAQISRTTISSASTTTLVIPTDSTIPQSGEGAEVASVSFTPKFTSSTIEIEIDLQLGGGGNAVSVTVFSGLPDADNCRSATFQTASVGTIKFSHVWPSWGQTAKTLSVRYGPNAGTASINRDTGGTLTQGGCFKSTIIIREYKEGPF